ncbi:hypothetical protein MJH12_05285, partial [bacterium]|nr:hypothetical protein [bacterium]
MSQDNIDIGICFKTRLVGLKSRLSLWLLCFTVGCIGAICIALLVGHRTYVSKAILGFQPLEIIKEGQAKEILNTFKDSVKLESILSKVRKDLSLDMTLVQLAKHCDARIVKKTSLLTIQCSGETAIEALDVSKSVVEHFLRWQIEQRHLITTRKIQGHELRLKEINSSILNLESKVLKIQNNFLSLNLEQESQRLLLTLGSVKLKLEEAKIDKNSSISQRSSLDHILMSLKKKQKNDQDQFEQMEQLSDVSIRSKRLRENIKDNQLFRWHSAKLKKLKALYKRQVSLSEQGIIPISTLEATKSELDSASAYVFESKKTSAWKKELKKLDELVIPKSNTISKSSILLKEVMMKGLEIDLGRNSADNTIQHLEVMVKSIERTLKEISLSNQKLKLLNRDIDSLIKERYFIDERRNKLLSIVNSDLADFIYVSTPDLAIYPVKS